MRRLGTTVVGAFQDFFFREGVVIAIVVLVFVVLFKFTDALAGVMTGAVRRGSRIFTRNEYATIIKGVGLVAMLIGGFAGGYVARAFPLATSLWIGGILQALANLAFSWQATSATIIGWLTFAITLENFTSAIGTVIFVAYLSALCQKSTAHGDPIRAADRTRGGRAYLSVGRRGFYRRRHRLGLVLRDLRARGDPRLLVLAWLQRGHFERLIAATTNTTAIRCLIAAESVPSSR